MAVRRWHGRWRSLSLLLLLACGGPQAQELVGDPCTDHAGCSSGCCVRNWRTGARYCAANRTLEGPFDECYDQCQCVDNVCELDSSGQFERMACTFPHMVNAITYPFHHFWAINRRPRNLTSIATFVRSNHNIDFQYFAPPACAAADRAARNKTRFTSTALALSSSRPPGACPLADRTFCDEFDALDTDCNGALDGSELMWTQTLFTYDDQASDTGYTSHRAAYRPTGRGQDGRPVEPTHNLPPMPWDREVTQYGAAVALAGQQWAKVFAAADVNSDRRV